MYWIYNHPIFSNYSLLVERIDEHRSSHDNAGLCFAKLNNAKPFAKLGRSIRDTPSNFNLPRFVRYLKIAVAHIFRSAHQFRKDRWHTRIEAVAQRSFARRVRQSGLSVRSREIFFYRRIRRALACRTCVHTAARAKKEGATRSEANEVQIERGRSRNPLERVGAACSWVNSSRREAQRDTPAANVENTWDCDSSISSTSSSSPSLGSIARARCALRFAVDLR